MTQVFSILTMLDINFLENAWGFNRGAPRKTKYDEMF